MHMQWTWIWNVTLNRNIVIFFFLSLTFAAPWVVFCSWLGSVDGAEGRRGESLSPIGYCTLCGSQVDTGDNAKWNSCSQEIESYWKDNNPTSSIVTSVLSWQWFNTQPIHSHTSIRMESQYFNINQDNDLKTVLSPLDLTNEDCFVVHVYLFLVLNAMLGRLVGFAFVW